MDRAASVSDTLHIAVYLVFWPPIRHYQRHDWIAALLVVAAQCPTRQPAQLLLPDATDRLRAAGAAMGLDRVGDERHVGRAAFYPAARGRRGLAQPVDQLADRHALTA